jgi:hypothetical protein
VNELAIGQFPTEQEFSEWLEQNPDRGRYSSYHCPLAECLKDGGVPAPMVLEKTWTEGRLAKDPKAYRELPEWAILWRARYDKIHEFTGSKQGESGLFDPMMGDVVEDDIGPPAPGEGDDLDNPEIGMPC